MLNVGSENEQLQKVDNLFDFPDNDTSVSDVKIAAKVLN